MDVEVVLVFVFIYGDVFEDYVIVVVWFDWVGFEYWVFDVVFFDIIFDQIDLQVDLIGYFDGVIEGDFFVVLIEVKVID